jgi:8-oxo-dGTP pyrophosphatase MutT (NUDIX family)
VSDAQTVEQVSSRIAYETRYLRLHEDVIRWPDGSPGIYSYVERPDFALVIPVENGGFHLVEQYRYPLRKRSLEFPQGTHPGLDPTTDAEALAHEELRQETGLRASAMRRLGLLDTAKGFARQGCHVFVASGLTHGEPELELEEQDLLCRWFPRAEVEQMIRSGQITDDASVAAYTLLLLSPGSWDEPNG